MSDTEPEGTFFFLGALCLALSIALAVGNWRLRSHRVALAQMGIGALGSLVLPLLLQLGWPVARGMDTASRVILFGALSMANGVACVIGCTFSAPLARRTKVWNAVVQIGLPLAFWAAILFS